MKKILKIAFDWIIAFVIALAIFSIVNASVTFGRISGSSMYPTYQDGQRVLVDKKGYDLEKGDVITFWADRSNTEERIGFIQKLYLNQPDLENKELHIKRIVGVPGDKIKIQEVPDYEQNIMVTEVYVNGELEVTSTKIRDIEPAEYKLADDEYFVVGDNYDNSLDSRLHGPIKEEDIFGKIINGREQVELDTASTDQ